MTLLDKIKRGQLTMLSRAEREELARIVERSTWVSVSERLPARSMEVEVWQGWIEQGYWDSELQDFTNNNEDFYVVLTDVTHWRELVKPEGVE